MREIRFPIVRPRGIPPTHDPPLLVVDGLVVADEDESHDLVTHGVNLKKSNVDEKQLPAMIRPWVDRGHGRSGRKA
jgi:hypothetical protein